MNDGDAPPPIVWPAPRPTRADMEEPLVETERLCRRPQRGRIPRTGQVQRIVFNERWEELRREPLLAQLKQRIRDIRQGPDDLLYVLTAEEKGALLRLEPDM
jgi:aldose sugar dehydrogenase